MDSPFDSQALGKIVTELLDLKTGDEVEVLRDKLNPMRIMIVRHPQPHNAQ
jgi:hypothetical protein